MAPDNACSNLPAWSLMPTDFMELQNSTIQTNGIINADYQVHSIQCPFKTQLPMCTTFVAYIGENTQKCIAISFHSVRNIKDMWNNSEINSPTKNLAYMSTGHYDEIIEGSMFRSLL